jgi:hypothetical protein
MMTTPTTVVTMFFDMKNRRDATERTRPKSFYLDKGRQTLKLNFPMVIFCDSTTFEDVKNLRNTLVSNAKENTTYIIKPFEAYDFYKYSLPIIESNRALSKTYINSKNTPSSVIIYMFKIHTLFLAKQLNAYNTPYYAWLDFGGSHIMRGFDIYAPKMLEHPNPKRSFCYIHYRSPSELSSVKTPFNNGECGVAGGAFTAAAEYVDQFYTGMMSIYYEMLSHKIGHGDEQVMTHFYNRYPESCTIYYGDYYSILSNYHAIREDYNTVKEFFIHKALAKGKKDLATAAANAALMSFKNNTLKISPAEVNYLKTIIYS